MLVFDASTLILLAKIDLLDRFLAGFSGGVSIPREVERECCHAKRTFDSLMIQKAIDESRIEVVAVKNKSLVAKVQEDFGLGRGEAEAIGLALTHKEPLLGIDDKNGLNACKLLAVPFVTAIGLLVRSREKGLLNGPEALVKLAGLAKYGRYRQSIIDDARSRLED